MNKFYVIIPLALMIAFGFYFNDFHTGYRAKQAADKAEADRKAAEEEKFQQDQANLAAQQAEQKRLDKEKKDAEEKAARETEQARIDAEVRESYQSALAEIGRSEKELNELETKLTDTRRLREKTEADAFKLAREVELTRIERRNAELELQRATQMLAERTEASALVEAPLFPTPQAGPRNKEE